ncbi:MAG: hypothetical protein WB785_00785 [Mycobacterium sp.]|uniref:hypothetical protein n=1 Tax=Mycobacterium sp. TaxID=1785 RepID=UPI003C4EB3D8
MKKLLTSIPAVLAAGLICAASPPAHADPNNPYGHNGPCNSRDVHVSKIDPQTGNAIEVWGPPGCDPSLPMTGDN